MYRFPLFSSSSRKVMAAKAQQSSLLRTYNMSTTILGVMRRNLPLVASCSMTGRCSQRARGSGNRYGVKADWIWRYLRIFSGCTTSLWSQSWTMSLENLILEVLSRNCWDGFSGPSNPELTKTPKLELNLGTVQGVSLQSGQSFWGNGCAQQLHPGSWVEVGLAPSQPSPGKPAGVSAGPGQCPQGAAGTWEGLGPHSSAVDHGDGGTGPGLAPEGLPWRAAGSAAQTGDPTG